MLWMDGGYPLNPLSLLSVLNECAFPSSFQVVKIKDGLSEIIKVFKSDPSVNEQFAANNWSVELDEKEDWIFIKKLW